MIKLSCNSATLPGLSLEDAMERHTQLGLTRLELILFMHGPDVENASSRHLARLAEKAGQQIIAIYPKPIDPWSEDRFEASVAGVKRAVDLARDLCVRRIVFPPLLPRDGFDYGRLVEGCEQVLRHIGERDILICLENHHGWPMCRPEDYRKVFSAVSDPRLGMAFDTGHFTASEVDMPAMIAEFLPRIHHVHLKDHIATQSVAFGRGKTDNLGVISALRKSGFEGYASIELEVEDKENLGRYLEEAAGYCRTRLGLM